MTSAALLLRFVGPLLQAKADKTVLGPPDESLEAKRERVEAMLQAKLAPAVQVGGDLQKRCSRCASTWWPAIEEGKRRPCLQPYAAEHSPR